MSDEGPNLRRLYLPGLEELKGELARFEQLLQVTQPALQAHLEVRRGWEEETGGALGSSCCSRRCRRTSR